LSINAYFIQATDVDKFKFSPDGTILPAEKDQVPYAVEYSASSLSSDSSIQHPYNFKPERYLVENNVKYNNKSQSFFSNQKLSYGNISRNMHENQIGGDVTVSLEEKRALEAAAYISSVPPVAPMRKKRLAMPPSNFLVRSESYAVAEDGHTTPYGSIQDVRGGKSFRIAMKYLSMFCF